MASFTYFEGSCSLFRIRTEWDGHGTHLKRSHWFATMDHLTTIRWFRPIGPPQHSVALESGSMAVTLYTDRCTRVWRRGSVAMPTFSSHDGQLAVLHYAEEAQ